MLRVLFGQPGTRGRFLRGGRPGRSHLDRASGPGRGPDLRRSPRAPDGHSGRLCRWVILCAILALPELPARAAEEAFASRTLAPEPGWQATAGAFAVTDTRPGALGANPAAALGPDRPTLVFSHLAWVGGLAREWAALAGPLGGRVGIGADVGLLRGASLEGYDEAGNSTGAFAPTEWDAGACLGLALGRGFELGLGARYYRLEDPTTPLSSVGASAGLAWRGAGRALALAVSDLGRPNDDRYTLPTRYRLGGEQWISHALRLGAALESGEQTAFSAGAEIHPASWFALLGGLGSEPAEGGRGTFWSTGMRIERAGVQASYAYVLDGELGDRHHLGFELPLRRTEGGWKSREGSGQTP